MSNSLQPHELYSPWNSPGHNTGVGSLSLLQGIFPTQESNQGLLHYRWILYQLSCEGSPKYDEKIAPYISIYNSDCCCSCCVPSVVSDSVRPHRWQPTRLLCPWDSPGKNTGVDIIPAYMLFQWYKMIVIKRWAVGASFIRDVENDL